MVDFDPNLAALSIATIGVLLWIATQVHLIRVARRIEAGIDSKRQETQIFVDSRISKLEATVGGFEARMTAQMPPNVHGELEQLKGEFTRQFQEIDRGLTAALSSIDQSFKGVIGNMGDAERELRKELANVDGEGQQALEALQEAARDEMIHPAMRGVYRWAARPPDPKLEAKNPVGYAALQAGKALLLDKMEERMGVPSVRLKKGGAWNPGLK